jgi:nicotinamide-nucleotide amidase|tara:strand:+ start:9137 stop:10396 length:1260 start_codon:yes stop_codon:yes gene_type:complete
MHKPVTAEIISIGDELLYGQILDTNSKWLSEEMDKIGVRVIRKTTIGDDPEAMIQAFKLASKKADIILMTGGLGPTKDDLTKNVLAEFFNSSMKLFPDALEDVRHFFESRGRELSPTNRSQAYLPSNCTYIQNAVGTAPGMWFEEYKSVWMSMPGVPHEMKYLMENAVIPKIKEKYKLPVIYHKVIKTIGIGESWLSDIISEWEDQLPSHIRLAYLPSLGEVKLRLTGFGNSFDLIVKEVDEEIDKLEPLISKYIYGFNTDTIASAIGQTLIQNNENIAIAESCTGGYLSHVVTSIPGASNYYNGGIIPYHNAFKENLLGVDPVTLSSKGAVSEDTVIEMSKQVRLKFKSTYGLATSGVAGPGGGSKEKPVGLVWIACHDGEKCLTRKLQLTKDRLINIQLTSTASLNLLRETILQNRK